MNKANIYIDNRQDLELDPEIEEAIGQAVLRVLSYEARDLDYEVSLSLVDNQEIQELNRDYRSMDRATDVLSFPAIEDFDLDLGLGPKLLGDIVISLERAREQALDYGHSLEREVIYLVVHSMLHLLGYDHMEDGEKQLMRSKEKDIMSSLEIYK